MSMPCIDLRSSRAADQQQPRTSISLADPVCEREVLDWHAYGSSAAGAALISRRRTGGSDREALVGAATPPAHCGHPQLELRRHGPECLVPVPAGLARWMGRSSSSFPVARLTSRNKVSCSEHRSIHAICDEQQKSSTALASSAAREHAPGSSGTGGAMLAGLGGAFFGYRRERLSSASLASAAAASASS